MKALYFILKKSSIKYYELLLFIYSYIKEKWLKY